MKIRRSLHAGVVAFCASVTLAPWTSSLAQVALPNTHHDATPSQGLELQAEPVQSPQGGSTGDPVFQAALDQLLKRRAELDARNAELDRRDSAAGQALLAERDSLQQRANALETAFIWARWREETSQKILTQIQAQDFINFAIPKASFKTKVELIELARENQSYLRPDLNSRAIRALAKGEVVMKVGEVTGTDWVLVWLDEKSRFSFIPKGATILFERDVQGGQ